MKTRLSALPHAARTTRTALPARLLGSTALCALALMVALNTHPASAAEWWINSDQILNTNANYDGIVVGRSANGTLTISGSAYLRSTDVSYIGYNSGMTGAVTVTGTGSTWANSDSFYVGYYGSGTLSIAEGGTLSNTDGYIGTQTGSTGTVTVTGTGSSWANSGSLTVGDFGSGTLTIADGGTVSNTNGSIGSISGSTGTVTVTGAGSSWTNSGILAVGDAGTGSLTIADGGAVSNVIGYIAATGDSISTVTVTGAGSTWNNSSALYAGYEGSGTLTIADGGTVTAGALDGNTQTYDGTLTIAYYSGSTGTLNIGAAAGQTAVAAGTLQAASVVFGNGTGTIVFNHTDTDYTFAAAISGYGMIKVYSGTTTLSGDSSGFIGTTDIYGGTLTVTGTLGSATSPADITLEGGSLIIADGGTVRSNAAAIGSLTGSSGSVTVTGDDSTWTNSDGLYVGYYGSGSLTISDGSTVSSYEGVIGYESGSSGSVTVTGDDSTWTNSDGLYVGYYGSGSLTISDGGTVSSYNSVIGYESRSSGSATVTGAGSTWTTNQSIYVGSYGSGTLTISDGGMVSSDQGLIGYNSGSSGSATVTGAGSTWTNSSVLYIGLYGSGSLTITEGGTVSNDTGYIGLVADSTGTVTVTGTGSTWTNSGYLYAGHYGSGTLTIADGGTVTIGALDGNTQTYDGTLTIAYHSGSAGTLIIGAAAGEAAVAAGTLQAASVVFGDGAGTIVFNHTETDYTFAADISGDGTLDFDSGTTTLSGDNSNFTGTTTVDDATLIINSVLGGTLQINGGGTLSGTGTIGTTTLASGGTISPGLTGTIGTLTVAGNLTFASGSAYAVDISSSASDQILVTGTADISGGTVSVTALDAETSYQTGQTYTILSAGTVTGSFAQTLTSSAFLDVSTETVDNTAVLTIALRTSGSGVFTPKAKTTTQSAVASSLDTLAQSGASLELYNDLLLMSEDEAVETFQQMSGEVYASERSALASNAQSVNTTVNSRIRAVFDGVAAPSVPVLGYAEDTGSSTDDEPFVAVGAHNGPAQAVAAERFAVWGSAFGSWGTMDGTDGASDTDTASGGVLTGIDKLFLDTVRLGAFAGYSHSTFDTSSSSGNSGNYHAGLYGGTELGHLALRSGLSYTWHDVSTSRRVTYLGQTLKGSYNASSFNVFGELGYRMDLGSNAFEPFAGLAHTQLETDGLTETGGSAALTVDSSTMDTTYTTLGLRASREFLVHGVSLTARGSAAWQHAFGDIEPLTTARFISGDSFSVSSTPIDENVAVLEAGFDIKPTANAILGFSYTGQIGENAVENGVNAKLRMKF